MSERCESPCGELTFLEQRLNEYESQNRASHQQIYDRLRDVEMSDAVQKEQYTTILEKVEIVSKKLDSLESKPGKRWESLGMCALTAVTTIMCGYLLKLIGIF